MKWYVYNLGTYISPIYKITDEYYFCAEYLLKDKYHDEDGYGYGYYQSNWVDGRRPIPFSEDQLALIHGIFEFDIEPFEE